MSIYLEEQNEGGWVGGLRREEVCVYLQLTVGERTRGLSGWRRTCV